MSLFAGTSFMATRKEDKQKDVVKDVDNASSSEVNPDQPQSDRSSTLPRPLTGNAAGGAAPANWSASLRFAPTVSRKQPKSGSSSTGAVTSSLARPTAAAASTNGFVPSGFKPAVASTAATLSTFTAAPVLISSSSVSRENNSSAPSAFKAPSMTLDMTSNRAPETHNNAQGNQKRRKKNKNHPSTLLTHPIHIFSPDEPYNPAKPNDLDEYRDYRKAKRAERRARRAEEEEERKRREVGRKGGAESDSSHYSEDYEEDGRYEEAPRRDAPRAFAPPTSLYGSSTMPSASSHQQSQFAPTPPPQASISSSTPTAITPAFQHPEHRPTVLDGQEAYARRIAMSVQTADEAYARRVALSSGMAAPAPVSAAHPSSAPSFVSQQPYNTSTVSDSQRQAPQKAPPRSHPSFVPASSSAFPESASPSTSASPAIPEDFQKKFEERKKAAAAIAARLAALNAYQGSVINTSATDKDKEEETADGDIVDVDPDDLLATLAREVEQEATSTFAEKMMRKWGHKEGQGLGSRGDGIVHALSAEHIRKPQHQQSAPSSMGRLVNKNENERAKADLEQYGEPSEVICLQNMVASPEEVDEDLADEIAEECTKNGVVEKVVIHIVQPPPVHPSHQIRIFVQFSGLAGAWKTVKDMDGRFFGGREVRATYFPLIKFVRGERDGPIL